MITVSSGAKRNDSSVNIRFSEPLKRQRAEAVFMAGVSFPPLTVKSLRPLRAYIVMKPGWMVAQLREPRTAMPYMPS